MVGFYSKILKKAIAIITLAVFLVLPVMTLAKVPNDANYPLQMSFWDNVNAPLAWDYSTGSSDVVVAVIDSGADILNPDLVTNIWQNPREIAGNGIDDDNNGFVDDINGWNFVENNSDIRNAILNRSSDEEAVSHGTLVAGLIGAVGNNGRNGTGINWQVKIMPLRAIDNLGSGSYTDITRAVDYAVRNGARVISMSFVGENNDPVLRDSLRSAYEKGIVIVAAAGNNRDDTSVNPYYPLCYDAYDSENWILGVTSINSNNRLSSFANYGRCVDIAAPGERIYSTEHYLPEQGYNQEFGGMWQGTSFATPIVAGTAALLKATRPEWKAKEIINQILQTAQNIDNVNTSFVGQIGRGKLNAGTAVQQAAETRITKKPALITNQEGTLVYVKDNSLMAFNTAGAESSLLARVQDGKLIDWGNNEDGGWSLLIYRAPYYFVQIRDNAGEFVTEFPVGDVDELKAKKVNITRIDGAFREEEQQIVVAENKKTATDIVVFSLQGEEINRFTINKKLDNWSVYGNYVATAHFQTANLILRLYTLDGELVGEKIIAKAYGLDDLDIGMLWGGDSPQVVALVRKSRDRSKLERTVVDLGSNSTLVQGINNPGTKTRWYLALTDIDGDGLDDYLPYRLIGGKHNLYSGKGELLATWQLPKL